MGDFFNRSMGNASSNENIIQLALNVVNCEGIGGRGNLGLLQ